jgi:poly(A) polymerase
LIKKLFSKLGKKRRAAQTAKANQTSNAPETTQQSNPDFQAPQNDDSKKPSQNRPYQNRPPQRKHNKRKNRYENDRTVMTEAASELNTQPGKNQKSNILSSVSRDNHTVSRKNISTNALKVLSRLRASGYEAYLVGGCVRDLLLNLRPKDFDIATNATPEQVKAVFNNSRIIGRRFKLIHVVFGRDVIEVATFRGTHADLKPKDKALDEKHISRTSDEGMLLRDNVYGSLDEDAQRRDFTINASYYSIADFSIRAYPGAMNDMDNKLVRIIGDAELRYREDPVRMLRAIRFAGKLGFTLEQQTAAPIHELSELLFNIPAARLFDEVLKLLQAGQGVATWQLLNSYNLARTLFPNSVPLIAKIPYYRDFVQHALANTDKRIGEGKTVNPAFIYAAILWPVVCEKTRQNIEEGIPEVPAAHQAFSDTLAEQVQRTAIPKRLSAIIRDIWDLQSRFTKRSNKKAEALLGHPKFRAAYDFLLLREQAGEDTGKLGDWWTKYHDENPELRYKPTPRSFNNHRGGGSFNDSDPKKRRPRRPYKGDSDAGGGAKPRRRSHEHGAREHGQKHTKVDQ